MIYFSDNKFNFYTNRVDFISSQDGKQFAYCNNIQDYIDMVKNYPWQFSNLTHTQVVPSVDQQTRLELLNNLEVENKNTYESECVLFVEHGVILPSTVSTFLLDVAGDYITTTEAYIQTLQESVWVKIKAIRDGKITNGGYKVEGKWYHSDTVSRSQQTGLYLMGENVPVGLMWKTMDGSFVEMTQELAQKIFFAAASQDSALFNKAEALRQEVNSSEAPWDVDIESDWPETFQDTQA